jgi:uncharacterized lipoprotein YmbA
MTTMFSQQYILFVAATGLLFSGCSFKRVTDSPRHFVLAPIPEPEQPAPAATQNLSVGIGFIRLPPELLRDSIAVQSGTNEFEYLENALWAERLDHGFERTVAANLSRLLSSDSIYTGNWSPDQVTLRVSIQVEKFEVDTLGNGTLLARWRIKARDNDHPVKTGLARVTRTGASPLGKPEVIVNTLSDLTADFSRDLARAIRESSEKFARAD